jgi:hypothetical protein
LTELKPDSKNRALLFLVPLAPLPSASDRSRRRRVRSLSLALDVGDDAFIDGRRGLCKRGDGNAEQL